ncbi:MAG TPA: S9 family peptidase [Thermoanaerobaculia bacterium]|nr:S9 family peptidase [Thermoanaerobaculia bacterium]
MKRLLCLLFLVAVPALAQTKRAFTIEDLYRVRGLGDLSLSPDGATVLFTVVTSDLPHAKRTTRIWAMNADGSNARELTHGDSDTSPHFSPDGKSIAFLRSDNIYLLPLGGGEAKQLTTLSTGVSDPLWSPDGKSIAFAADVYPECGADDACNEKVADRWSKGKLQAHMADSLLYRHWTEWRDGKVTHTLLLDVDTQNVRDLTPGRFDFPGFQLGGPLQYAFSPDSTELTVASNHDAEPASSTNADLWVIDLKAATPTPRNITAANHGYDDSPQYSPDGRTIAYRTQKTPAYESELFQLALYDRQSGTSRIVSGTFDNWIDDFHWSEDGKSIVFSGPVEGINPLYRLDLASGAIRKIYEHATIDAFEVSKLGDTLYYIERSVGEPSEIYRVSLTGSAASTRRKLTHINDAFVNEVDVRRAEAMWVNGARGEKVQVYIVKPHGFDPAKKYPLILNVHGGPQSQFGDAFRGDWQVYPGAGYIVAFPNAHGSTGRGQAYTAEISGDWGGAVFEDLMKVTDALEALPYVDKSRMGAMGWSYGGYMMNWFEGHTDRFKAIATMMGIFDNRSFFGATEESWFPEWDLKGQPWNSALYEKWSPSNFVTNFKTPCLVITGERDYRVPYTQSLQMFTALQKQHVPSRLIVFSKAGHWPSWYEMMLYYTAHLEWFQKYLGGGGPPWSTEAFLRNAVFDTSSGQRIDEKEKAPENLQGKPAEKPKS